jgi:hypothetical protein
LFSREGIVCKTVWYVKEKRTGKNGYKMWGWPWTISTWACEEIHSFDNLALLLTAHPNEFTWSMHAAVLAIYGNRRVLQVNQGRIFTMDSLFLSDHHQPFRATSSANN